MTGIAYRGVKNDVYTAATRIGGGGEGTVYAVKEHSGLVIKIYTEALDRDKTEKLLFMPSLVNDDLVRFAAWPVDVVRNNAGQVCGFVMKKLESYVPLHMLFSPMDRKRLFPDKGYNFLVHVARNLAVAFHKIHQLGIVVGDVNEANILVSASGMVALIDCDSFQIKNGSRYHFCEVGIPRYTPPELLARGSFDNVVRTANTDAFSLATLIFQLLFLGRTPFTGINPGSQEIDEETAIKAYEFAYSLRRKNKRLFPAKHSLELSALTTGVINSFHDAFETNGTRPAPLLWANELKALSDEIIQCSASKIHFYPKKMNQCPWCAFKANANILYFLDDSYLKTLPELNDIEQFVNGFKLNRLQIKPLPTGYARGGLKANAIDNKFIQYKRFNELFIVIAVIAVVALALLNFSYIFAAIPLLLLLNLFLPTRLLLKRERARRKEFYDGLYTSFEALKRQHSNPRDFMRYNQSANKLTGQIQEFRDLPTMFNKAKKEIEEKHYQVKYVQYLAQFDVRNNPITSFGPAKKTLIYKNGIRNAADIFKLKQVKISGIGPKNEQILYDWQRRMGAGFTYYPDAPAINKEISIAANGIVKKRKQLEEEIKQEYKTLNILRANILPLISILEKQYYDLAPKVYQAELDLKAFQPLVKG